MAKRKSAVAEAAPSTITEQPVPQMTDTVTPTLPAEGGQKPYERLPEIREMKSIKLGPDRDSPRLRLLRNRSGRRTSPISSPGNPILRIKSRRELMRNNRIRPIGTGAVDQLLGNGSYPRG
jgi:hypothetical protein